MIDRIAIPGPSLAGHRILKDSRRPLIKKPIPQPVLNQLAGAYGTEPASLVYFSGGREDSDGILYAYPYQDRRRLFKIMAIPQEELRRGVFCLEERLRFIYYLGQKGAPVILAQLSPQGNLYETFLYEPDLWIGYTMEIAPGKLPKESAWEPEFFTHWGQLVGNLHRLALEYPSWEASLDPETGKAHLTWREEWRSFYDWSRDDQVREKWVEILADLERLPVNRQTFGFIHNDPHQWNLLVDGDRLTLIDFDVANHHWFINDIAIACQSILFSRSGGMDRPVDDRKKLLEFLDCFLAGYEREHRLDQEWLDRLDLFIAYRRILLFTAMQGWIQSKPELHKTWKEMILSQPPVVQAD